MKKLPPTQLIPFYSLGEYRLHYHYREQDELTPPRPFNCTIRNREELQSERIELHRGEELHGDTHQGNETPLLRYDELGLWGWQVRQKLWWPLRNLSVTLGLDRCGNTRLRYLD